MEPPSEEHDMRQAVRLSGWVLLLVVLLGVAGCGSRRTVTVYVQPNGLPVLYDYDDAVDHARREDRLLLVHFTSPTCAYCIEFMNIVLPDPGLEAISHAYVEARLRPEYSDDADDVFEDLNDGVRNLPQVIVVDPRTGAKLATSKGPDLDVAAFAAFLESAARAANR